MSHKLDQRALDRWRLVLGRFSHPQLGAGSGADEDRIERALDHLYGREYTGRGVRGAGGTGRSVLSVPDWIREVRDLFPQEVCETITRHALDRYGMTDLVTDADTLERLTPSYDLLKSVLTFRGLMQGRVLTIARRIIRQVVDELRRTLESEVRRAMSGKLDRTRRSRFKVARNLDVERTIRANLKRYDPSRRKVLATDLRFCARVQRRLPWDIVFAVDCSGSMIDSVIHAAVMAGIFHALPAVHTRLVAFDTTVRDSAPARGEPDRATSA